MSDWRDLAGEVRTVPNLVSLSRLPLVVGIVLLPESPLRYVLFALVVFSDGVDGWLARRLDQETELGALLDPALDKLTALVLVVALFPRTGLALEYLLLFFARDVSVLALGPLVPLYGFDTSKVRARPLGKIVTNAQFLAIVAMLVPAVLVTEALLWLVGAAAALAIADYVVFVARELSERPWLHETRTAVAVYVAIAAAFVAFAAVFLGREFVDVLAALGV